MTYQDFLGQPFDFSFEDRDFLSWFIAISLSLVAHFVFILNNQELNAAPASVNQETITHVRFSTFVPPPVNVVEPVIEKPKPEPIVPPEPQIIPEPPPKPRPVKKVKQVKPKPKPRPVKKKVVKPKPVVKQKKQVVKQKASTQRPSQANKPVKASPVVAPVDPRLIEKTRMTYQAMLMRHIDVHKQYPRVARKRKIQGEITVTFTLLADGNIKNLTTIGKRSILKKATVQAVKDALPMPRPPKQLSLPMEIKFKMDYFLK